MRTHEILIEVRKLLDDPARHTTGAFARDKQWANCEVGSRYATQWCVMGALEKVIAPGCEHSDRAYSFIYQAISPTSLAWFNDHYSHDEVLAALDKAIALAEEAVDART